MTQRLFVYGTLGPTGPNAHVLCEVGGTWREASVRGHLENTGWGADIGYPAISLDSGAEPVNGHVFESENLMAHWATLDAFEGPEYERVPTCVEFSDKSHCEAFIYVSRR